MIILWIALFLIIIGISFVLAFQSMKDYSEAPEQLKVEYGLFLIRRIENFNSSVLESIRKLISEQGLIISFERLFKGSQAALVIFGPKGVLEQFKASLDLLELEDYTEGLDTKGMVIWEVGTRHTSDLDLETTSSIFEALPLLREEDQFFWQVVIGSTQIQIRAALYCQDPLRRKTLASSLQNLKFGKLIKVPRPYGTAQMLTFYKERMLSRDSKGPILDSLGLMRLLKI